MALPALYADETLLDQDIVLDKDRYTEDDYFALEERSPERWEFLPDGPPPPHGPRLGRIRAMSGGTFDHSAIASNLITTLTNALRGAGIRTCRVFNSDFKIHTAEGRNTYPDVGVVCGKPDLYRRRQDILTNPVFVAEVLSPSTESHDRGDKWASYQTIPTLQHYLLVTTTRTRVEVHIRTETNWQLDVYEDIAAQIPLPALGITISVAEVYDQVDFEAEA